MTDVNSDSTLIAWAMAAGGTIVAALASTVAFLFKTVGSQNEKAILALQVQNAKQETIVATLTQQVHQCEEDRGKLFCETAVLREKVELMDVRIKTNERKLA